ncbi:MAG TPA: tripartite tricarboxylate transporter substrate binding protein, partial [Burkholderiales bacterium]|nr:tripartite tricarboxylate transporter substrate binding protein [Burkholderiales bacterium]
LDRLNREVQRAMKEPVVLERFKALAVNLAEPMTPEQFGAYVRTQYARYGKLLPELNIGQ